MEARTEASRKDWKGKAKPEEMQEKNIRRLFWAIIRIVLSVNFSIFGIIRIDFLPGFLGYAAIWETMQSWKEEVAIPRYVGRLCAICGVWDGLSWLPWLYERIPAPVVTFISAGVVLCNCVIVWYMLRMICLLAEHRGRTDLAASGDRYARIFAVGYPLLGALHSMLEVWQAPLFTILLIFELMLAAYVANCNYILFPESEGKREVPQM